MVEAVKREFIWAEKYRPQTIDECILPERLKKEAKEFVKQGDIPHLLFSGGAGIGKTTLAYAMANELGADVLFINASLEGNIDTLRTTILQFASTVSFGDGIKIVLLDEADYLTDKTQPALRGFFDEFSANCKFILTCNFKHRIIDPLHSRCTEMNFKVDGAEKKVMATQFFKRMVQILKAEGVEYDEKVVAEIVKKSFPDFRKTLGELQRNAASGKIDSSALVNLSDENYKELIAALKDKDYGTARKWVGKNLDQGVEEIFRRLYDTSGHYLEPQSVPNLILILADYQYKNAFVADKEINLLACITEIMAQCAFKEWS